MRVKTLIILLMLCTTIASAQTGTLKGKVTDKQNNEPVPSSYITIELPDTIIAADSADINGEYTIRPVPPGRYTVKAAYPGYQIVAIPDVIVKADQTTYVDLRLIPGAAEGEKKKKVKLKRAE